MRRFAFQVEFPSSFLHFEISFFDPFFICSLEAFRVTEREFFRNLRPPLPFLQLLGLRSLLTLVCYFFCLGERAVCVVFPPFLHEILCTLSLVFVPFTSRFVEVIFFSRVGFKKFPFLSVQPPPLLKLVRRPRRGLSPPSRV